MISSKRNSLFRSSQGELSS